MTAADDRVFVGEQDDPKQNGIYIASAGAWVRSRDFDSNRDVTKGTRVSVTDGTVNANTTWVIVTSANPITVGTSDITFASVVAVEVAKELNSTNKASPVNADRVFGSDSAASFGLVYYTWTQIKAFLFASPALTGNPTSPTPSPGDDDTSIATTGFVKAAFDVLKGGVSAAFDTLQEIATSLAGKLTASSNLSDVASATTAATNLGLGTGNSPQFAGINLGAASDTTLTRSAAGKLAVEGLDVVLLSGAQTLAGKTFTDPIIDGCIAEEIFTITDAAAFSIDPSNGSIQTITLGANRTPVATNFANGESMTLKIADGTAFAITWTTAAVVWKSGTAPTLATTGFTVVELWKEGGVLRGVHVGDFAS